MMQDMSGKTGTAGRRPAWRNTALASGLLGALVLAASPALAQQRPARTGQAAAPAPAAAPDPVGYLLGPNDTITVQVYGQDEFNVQTRIKPDGSIVMPLVGKVTAAGKTVLTLADEIRQKLVSGHYLTDPIVNIEVNEYNSRYVRVVGHVGAPGLVPLERSQDLLDVLLRAGWVRADGSQYVIVRKAATGQDVKVNIDDLARGLTRNVQLSPGDTVYVAEAELVYLTGAVARPGPYALKPDMTISELIAQAGGVGPTGSSGKFGLKRGDADEIKVDGQTKLQAGDVVNVKERLF